MNGQVFAYRTAISRHYRTILDRPLKNLARMHSPKLHIRGLFHFGLDKPARADSTPLSCLYPGVFIRRKSGQSLWFRMWHGQDFSGRTPTEMTPKRLTYLVHIHPAEILAVSLFTN